MKFLVLMLIGQNKIIFIDNNMKKEYKSCEFCNCIDCQTGKYRTGSWPCPALGGKIICQVCCTWDMDDIA